MDSPPVKKPKKDVNEVPLLDLSTFKLEKILNNNTGRKTINLLGKFEAGGSDAVIILEKPPFEELQADSGYFTEKNQLQRVFQNDVYGDYKCFPDIELNSLKATIIHPATDKHIVKYSTQRFYIIDETPEIYKNVTLPHIQSEQLNLNWVYNILEHKSEAERIIFQDTDPNDGFVLVPDLKWNGALNTLHLLAIVHKRGIKSLRDLNATHLPLLTNIQKKCIAAIESKYGLKADQLRIYLHYQPSFYHLHVHFTSIQHEAPGILAERAHLLSNVISNISLLGQYYELITLPFAICENDSLFTKLKAVHNE